MVECLIFCGSVCGTAYVYNACYRFYCAKMKVIEEAHLPVLNKIVFNVFFPFLMFNNIYAFDLSADFNASLLLYAVVAVAVIYGLSVGFALIFENQIKVVVP